MSRFDVLKRETNIASHLILEASAGTGKTFTIENLVVRLLVEGENPLKIEQILIVTFTKLATSDLRERVRDTIERAMNVLEEGEVENFDYLAQILVNEKERIASRRRLERALIAFDEAQIFTIHSFCYRMLSEHGMDGNVNPDPKNEGKGVGEEQYKQCVLDYFRTGLSSESIGAQHRKHALNTQRGQVDLLQKKLGETIGKGVEIARVPSYQELFSEFKENVDRLKTVHNWSLEKLKSDLEKLLLCMKKVKGLEPSDVDIIIDLFSKEEVDDQDFERLVEVGPLLLKFFDPSNKKKKFPDDKEFFYPHLREILITNFQKFKSKNIGIARMAYECQKLMRRKFEEEELRSFDDLLELMAKKLKDSYFLQTVRSQYCAAIVDEFQDTDPRQWDIIKMAFPPDDSGWGHLYLVGDPKQSIYAFRQADIYTYLEAAEAIGQNNCYSLEINYRSQPSLVKALNYLFNAPFDRGWIPLPKLNKNMKVPVVQWDKKKEDRDFHDNRAALHFCIDQADKYEIKKSEEEAFFPFIVQEIQRLHAEESVPFSAFAILVGDRHQAKRMSAYLKKWNIYSQRQRVEPVSESSVIPSLKELLFGLFHYRDESAFKTALGGLFIRWDFNKIQTLCDDAVYGEALSRFKQLEEIWREEGLSVCMEELLHSSWEDSSETILEKLLKQENGDRFYADYQHVMELILEEPRTQSEVIGFLEKFKTDVSKSEEELKRRFDCAQDSVQILTIHSSKGLEYEIVFALGLVNRSRQTDLYYVEDGILRFVLDPEEEGLIRSQKELDAEKMRQLYVACTRPKHRLYLPYIETKANKKLGISSPMELFIQQFNVPFKQFLTLSQSEVSISYTLLNEVPAIMSKNDEKKTPELQRPVPIEIQSVPMEMNSFSSLAKKASGEQSEAPHQFDHEVKSCHTLPAGSETGTLLHTLLEEIPFSLGNEWLYSEEVIPLVIPYTKGTKYEEWNSVLADMIFHTIKTPFVDGTSLQDLDPNQCKFEAEFLYSDTSENYMKGFIDFMFYHEGKYYLLDWKSNWLGDSFECYSEPYLEETMKQHDYYLQSIIYTKALNKYLNLVQRKPFSEVFGGVYYIFLRGLPTDGVKYIEPSIFSS